MSRPAEHPPTDVVVHGAPQHRLVVDVPPGDPSLPPPAPEAAAPGAPATQAAAAGARAAASLAEHRAAVRSRHRWALTATEAVVHRRLLGTGRTAEARALIDQAERFFLTARDMLGEMTHEELDAFSRAIEQDDAAQRYQVVAAVLLRTQRDAAWRQVRTPVLLDELDRDDY